MYKTVSKIPLKRLLFHKSCSTNGEAIENFESEFIKNRISINPIQQGILAVGSAAMAILDPKRGDMIATMGEVTGESAARYILNKMKESEEGRQILHDRPRITSKHIDLEKLKTYPEGSFGKAYSDFLTVNDVSPDGRDPVRFIDNIDLAYAIQRYRDVHDLTHTLLGMPTHMLGEVTVKWVEAIQTKLPMCVGGALFGAVRLRPKQRYNYTKYYLPWALEVGHNSKFIMNLYFEKRWDQQVSDIYKEMNITAFKGPLMQKKTISDNKVSSEHKH